MLKYLKRQKSRHRSCEIGDAATDDVDFAKSSSQSSGNISGQQAACVNANVKRNSLRSTSSFCDEVFFEELASAESEEDAVSCGAGSLRSYASALGNGSCFNEDIFKHNSRLSMGLSAIINDSICFYYFVQYLETKDALCLIKFYMDIENFKKAAKSQIEKEQNSKCTTDVNGYRENDHDCDTIDSTNSLHIKASGKESKGNDDKEINDVPELKTICDLSMRKSITDDEKSQIYAETNKQITKCITNNNDNSDCTNNNDVTINNYNKNHLNDNDDRNITNLSSNELMHKNDLVDGLKRSSQHSLNSSSNESTITNQERSYSAASLNVSAASVKDVIAIYQKYLNAKSPYYVDLPISILSQISLLVCKKNDSGKTERNEDLHVTIDCFDEALEFAFKELESKHLNGFLQSSFYAKYCIELIENRTINQINSCSYSLQQWSPQEQFNICDVLFGEVALFFLMEYLEQQGERECLDFWTAAINFRKSYAPLSLRSDFDENEAQSDAMIIYEKFFSLQAENRLWSSKRLRTWVEERICATGQVVYCFDLPLQVIANYLERKYLNDFLKSQLFENYFNELKTKAKDDHHCEQNNINIIDTKNMKLANGCGGTNSSITNNGVSPPNNNAVFHKLSLRRVRSSPSNQSRHRKTLSDCSSENTQSFHKNLTGQKHLMNSMLDSVKTELSSSLTMPLIATTVTSTKPPATSYVTTKATSGNLHIDSRQLNNPNLLWQRSYSSEGGLKFGRVNSLGRYERDFDVVDDKHNWSFTSGSNKIKNAMRKLVNLPEDKVQEEIAWQVAEMIIKDVTSVTLPNADNISAQAL